MTLQNNDKLEFLDPNNDCGQGILKLVAAGSSIIAELLRLSNHIPDVFLFDSKKQYEQKLSEEEQVAQEREEMMKAKMKGIDPKKKGTQAIAIATDQAQKLLEAQLREDTLKLQQYEQRKYERILFDMKYLLDQQFQDECDQRLQNDIDMIDTDEQFKESYMDIIERFYTLFESIYQYYVEINEFISRVRENYYIDYTLETILLEKEGKRLLIEAYYNYAVMLLLLDRLIPAIARERILVCYVRYKSAVGSDNTTQVAMMVKGTGASFKNTPTGHNIPAKYPIDYFGRFNVDRMLIENLINALKDDDVYNQLSAYPNPHHRSAALANQSQIIFTLLFFTPRIMEYEHAKMREIADKHFPDNFVIQIYQGYLVDITQYWEPFTAAKKAIDNNIFGPNVKQLAEKKAKMIGVCFEKLTTYLVDGQLLEEYVLENIKQLLELLRDSNVTIRWLLLHNACRSQQYREVIHKSYNKDALVQFIFQLAKFEGMFETLIKSLVSQKAQIWETDRDESWDFINEIAEYFAGNRQWEKGAPDETYAEWFRSITEQIGQLDFKKSSRTGVKIQNLIQALEDIQVYDIIDRSVQIKHNIQETQKRLKHMVRIVQIKKQILINVSSISDFSYAWNAIDDFIPIMQKQIAKDPKTVLLLKTVYLKLASIMNVPLKRIIEYGSEDMTSVAKYYSGELVKFVKRTLSIIPTNIFEKLEEISVLLTKNLKEMETKMLKETLKDYACFDDRYTLAKRTHELSLLTEGMLVLDKTLMGVIELDPKEILVDGIRKELGKTLASMLHEGFIFSRNQGDVETLGSKFQMLKEKFTGLKRSLEYIQDFLNISGEQIWREELTRIINFAVEKEATNLVNKKYSPDLDYQDKYFVPNFIPVDANDFTFMGRLLRNITSISENLGKGMYLDSLSSWYDSEGKQMFGLRYVHFLHEHLGTTFLQGLDRLIVYTLISETKKFQRDYGFIIGGGAISEEMRKKGKRYNIQTHELLAQFDNFISQNFQSLNPKAAKEYAILTKHMTNISQQFIPKIANIGKLQLLRRLIVRQINFAAKVECSQYTACLETVNRTILDNFVEIKENAQRVFIDREYPEIAAILDQQQQNQNQSGNGPGNDDGPQLAPQQEQMKEAKEDEANKVLREFMKDMTTCLEFVGNVRPQNKVYHLTRDLNNLPLVMMLVTLNALQYLQYNSQVQSFIRARKEMVIDGPHYIMGLITIFRQYHKTQFRKYLMFIANYYKNSVQVARQQPNGMKALPPEVAPILSYLEELMRFEGSSRDAVGQILGSYVFDYFLYRNPT